MFSRTNYFLAKIEQLGSRHASQIAVFGVPFGKGQKKEGVENGPVVIRKGGLINTLKDSGNIVQDYGDITYSPPAKKSNSLHKYEHFAVVSHQISKMIEKLLKKDSRVCLLGGDHSVAMGSLHGHSLINPDLAVVWVDAHADINTYESSPTNNIHGMPVACISSELHKEFPKILELEWKKSTIPLSRFAYIGLRTLDNFEKEIIKKYSITAYSAQDVEKMGIQNVINEALQRIDPENKRPLHLSYDIDSLDPTEAPSTGTRERGGLSLREGLAICEQIHQTGRLKVMDLVEVNPAIGSLEDVERTVQAAVTIINSAFGSSQL